MSTPKDRRLFAKFTVDFPDHPKIRPLSDGAFRTLVEATIWSREHETDGFLARRLALCQWVLENLRELCINDEAKPSLIERDEGWYITDFTEHQDTKADIEARRRHAKTAGQLGGLAKAKRSAKRPAKQNGSKPLSKMLSKNVAEEEGIYYVNTKEVHAARSNGAAAHTPEPLAQALERAEREAEEIF